jgi:phenylacetate-CoA ligase
VSLATRAYSAAPVWLQEVMLSVYGARLRWLRYGAIQRGLLHRLRESQWLPVAELQRRQLESLNATLAAAAADVTFYRERGLKSGPLAGVEGLGALPVLTKEEVRQAGKRLVSTRYAGRRLEEIHTGGTTGTPLTIYCDRSALQRNYAFFERFREWAGVVSGSRVATFAGRILVPPGAGPPYWRRNLASNTLLFSSYHIGPSTLDAYAEALAGFKPDLIDSYPSSIELVARHLLRRPGLQIRPRAVITSSETLFPEARRTIEAAFDCPVFDHYGSAEMSALVTQCEAGSYHVNPEFGVVEVLRDGARVDPGERGEIVATGFINPVMPLLRYATGDSAIMGAGECSCGRAFPTLERIEGRMDDVIVTPEGHLVGRLDPIFKTVSSLLETRIVQDTADHVRVEVVVIGEFTASEQQTLLHGLRARLGPVMRIDILQVPSLARTGRGKLRSVVNEAFPAARHS